VKSKLNRRHIFFEKLALLEQSTILLERENDSGERRKEKERVKKGKAR